MNFLRLDDNSYLAVDLIAAIGGSRENPREGFARLQDIIRKDGARVSAYEHDVLAMLHYPQHIIKADPGTFELYLENPRLELDGSVSGVTRVPVIGWAVSARQHVTSFTALGLHAADAASPPVLLPSGQVAVAEDAVHDTLRDYVGTLIGSAT